jgi:hypothetical protein
MSESHQANLGSEQPKKLYATPQLIEYGSVEKLTQSASGTVGDGTGMNMQPCL